MGNSMISSAEEAVHSPRINSEPPKFPSNRPPAVKNASSSSSYITAADSSEQGSDLNSKNVLPSRYNGPSVSSTTSGPSLGARSKRESVISEQSSSSDETSPPNSSHSDGTSEEQRMEKKVYYIAREIMTSEKVFVEVLQLICKDFTGFIQTKMESSKTEIIPADVFSNLFLNLKEILTLNSELLREFEDRVENWENCQKIADVIVNKAGFYIIVDVSFTWKCFKPGVYFFWK